jgi:23S rRNA (guanosine2251-2'-O)-methyltransferase
MSWARVKGGCNHIYKMACAFFHGGADRYLLEDAMARKPDWIIEKERAARGANAQSLWIFGLHAVRDALQNPAREKLRLIVTKNAADKLGADIAQSGLAPDIVDARKFAAPIDAGSVHQGAALEVKPLNWGDFDTVVMPAGQSAPRLVLLDRVSDPHNVGAILRSAEVFGAAAVIAPTRHAAPETGALAKSASGALERQPYLRISNLGNTIEHLKNMGYICVGLDGTSTVALHHVAAQLYNRPVALVMGAEGPGLRARTKDLCDHIVQIPAMRGFGSLNVSNAAAVSLYAFAVTSGGGDA